MHITIFVYGTWGDIRAHVVLGMALQQAGHRVQVVASLGAEDGLGMAVETAQKFLG